MTEEIPRFTSEDEEREFWATHDSMDYVDTATPVVLDKRNTKEIREEYHEHPCFNGQYHRAVWVQAWTTGGTNEIEAPEGTLVTCVICGRARSDSVD